MRRHPCRRPTSDADKDDLAIADLGSPGPNILEESEEDAPAAATTLVGPTVPDFKGKTMRAVLAEAAELGLTGDPGWQRSGALAASAGGELLRQGERIRVRFSR